MDRRRFLQIAGLAGLAVVAPVGLRKVTAAPNKYTGPFWIMVNAGGGWDPTISCDPKGGTAGDKTTVNQSFDKSQIKQVGSISYAPTELIVDGISVASCESFFTKHSKRMMVINGVDTTTNNHDAGSRTTWSGQMTEGMPSLAAMVAALAGTDQPLPMGFLSSGGYDATGGLVPLTRFGSTSAVQRLAYPNVVDPTKTTPSNYHTQATASRIAAAQAARLQSMKSQQSLPTVGEAMSSLFMARQSDDGLALIGEELKKLQIVSLDQFPDLSQIQNRNAVNGLLNLMKQAQIALVSFKSGVAASANLNIGGFDSHDDNDNRQTSLQMQLLRALDYIFDEAEAMGIGDQVYVLVGSDFGRTPYYNDGNGKDHWNITSMLFSGPQIPGDRVIGGTDDAFKPTKVNPSTLKEDPGGIRIETKHIHKALRKLAGLTGTEFDKQFPLPGEDLPIFV